MRLWPIHRTRSGKSLLAPLLAIPLLAPISGCEANVQAHYNTAADAQRDGAFNRGTLPTILFPDATDIDEVHDFRVEHTGAKFHFTQPLLQRLDEKCLLYRGEERIDSPFASWPDFINHRQTAGELRRAKGYSGYRCGAVTVLIDSSGTGFLWH